MKLSDIQLKLTEGLIFAEYYEGLPVMPNLID